MSATWLLSATMHAGTECIKKEHALALSMCYFIVEPETCNNVFMAAKSRYTAFECQEVLLDAC